MYDLKTVYQLQEHFEVAHSTESTDVIQALKGIFDKAKRKILKQDPVDNGDFRQPSFESEAVFVDKTISPDCIWEFQDVGLTSSHTSYFKKVREKKINRNRIETNKILITLEKLICDISSDPEKRKEFEKSIVPWVPDSDVPLCPGCAKSFGLSRRWHHCRLCGYVMCNSCSFFISYDFARKLIVPAISDDQQLLKMQNSVARRPSNISLMSVVHLGSDHHLIRICKECNMLLQHHDKMVQQRNHRPVIVEIYDRLKDCINQVENQVPVYMEMLESLNSGETNYQLQDIQELKIKITKLAEKIDIHSKRIAKLEPTEEASGSHTIQLQSGIRMAASQFLRNMVIGLPSPPTKEELEQYRSQRLDQVLRRIQQEKEAELMLSKKETSKTPSPEAVEEEDDPLVQQMKNIRKYIQQAKMDRKFDEVKMLEANLKELKLEHARQEAEKRKS
ncbi:hypothetical protein JTE90_018056 [Oedothorax gibbosus]|uniref:FYVE-type domain-containing protein n=1 Tax=Oedothorax gibbosus TaxID=931172 RepID=A0AAV6TVK6_9ARAC|nr:hypothetical protein JTE90_018056 [Oedothorax gibbosus]